MNGEAKHWIASRACALRGDITVAGDKSCSHRAVMLAAVADGTSRIDGFLEASDTQATVEIFAQLGVRIESPTHGVRIVHGVGVDGLHAPSTQLDCGNAGTAMRLLCGVLAGQRFDSVLVGDASLSKRPMRRVIEPLSRLGARIDSSAGGVAPLHVHGNGSLQGIEFESEVVSAQIKSALLLAGLWAQGGTTVREARPTRDHTERMLAAFSAFIEFEPGLARIRGGQRLRAIDLRVPGDFSSAAFFIVAATLIPDSVLTLRGVGVNPRRTGLLAVLRAMGADITETAYRDEGGEPIADLIVRYAPLHGIEVPVHHVADMIDEFPALFIAAACARGTTTIRGAAELRVKESDRITVMAQGLRALGILIDELPDGAVIHGGRIDSGIVDSHGDHRVAMAMAVAGQMAEGEIRIGDVNNVSTSFPDFEQLARLIGCQLRLN